MKIKAVIFDVDGTLFSSENILHDAYARAIDHFNNHHEKKVKMPALPEILNQIGNTPSVIFQNLFPELSDIENTELGFAARLNLVDAIYKGRGMLYPHVKPTLSVLGEFGYLLRIASNGKASYINAIIDHYGLKDHFGPFIDLDEEEHLKDKGDILNLYKSMLNLKGDEMVMVGDRLADIEAARKAGCLSVGVTYGHGRAEELKSADLLIGGFDQMPDTLSKIS